MSNSNPSGEKRHTPDEKDGGKHTGKGPGASSHTGGKSVPASNDDDAGSRSGKRPGGHEADDTDKMNDQGRKAGR